ncbi:MAG: aconitase X [Nocardioidaceae bacterium]
MRLTDDERAILDGDRGEALARLLGEQVRVASFFGAQRFQPISNAHFMGDLEVLGTGGLRYLEGLAADGLRAAVPTTRNAQSVDFDHAVALRQSPRLIDGEREVRALLGRLGVSVVNTCIGYQTIYQPRFGEHVAWGDTGTVAYANSVLGARSNYESGAAGIAAAMTGRVPAYGFHLDSVRRANVRVRVECDLPDLADWGALGALVGEAARGYWNVPALELPDGLSPSPDQLKHFGASLASFGSCAMYHVVGVTPEAPTFAAANDGRELAEEVVVARADIDGIFARDLAEGGPVDLVVFSAPQLSYFEMSDLARRLEGRRVAESTQVIITTNSMTCRALEDQDLLRTITDAGALVLQGTCWYVMDPRAQRKEFGWSTLATNSAKLSNIIRAHGYTPALRPTAECVDAALTGRLVAR